MQPLQLTDGHSGQSPSSHTVRHQGHLALHGAAEDAELGVSRGAPGFASILVLWAIKIDAENTDV